MRESWPSLPLAERQQYVREFFDDPTDQKIDEIISLVRAPEGYGVYASTGPHYQYAIFGRDSIEFAEDVVTIRPELSKEIIFAVASLQGREDDNVTEERPGKIHHEYRALEFDGEQISEVAERIFDALRTDWGGSEEEMIYYGACDTTPLFLRLIGQYVEAHGADILDEIVQHHEGSVVTLREAAERALDLLVTEIEQSPWGLLEYRRLNEHGLYNQAWKDSNTSYLHEDGRVANADGGIASVEVQGYAYDALMAAADLLTTQEQEAEELRELARGVARRTLDMMWMEDVQFPAIGIDRDEYGNPRHIATRTSNGAAVLDSGLLEVCEPEERQQYLDAIVSRIMGDEFHTPAGVRLRSLDHADLTEVADYHGSLVTWPKETSDIARGMRRWEYDDEASRLEVQIRDAAEKSGEFYEFDYVDRGNRVKYHYRIENDGEPHFHEFGAADTPEPGQAWTISAVIRIACEGVVRVRKQT